MTEEELRALVRAAVARHAGESPPPADPRSQVSPAPSAHASHYLYRFLPSGTDACLIEPAVACTHCGYCQSHGH